MKKTVVVWGVVVLLALLLLVGVGSAFTVTDEDTGNPIEGALVTVEGTDFSTKTASDGTYTITDIPIGTYTVTCTKMGYYTQSRANIVVRKDETTTLDFSLVQKEPWFKWPSLPTFIYYEEIIFAVGAVVALWLIFVWWKDDTPKGKKKYVKSHSKMVPSRRVPKGKKTHINSYLRKVPRKRR